MSQLYKGFTLNSPDIGPWKDIEIALWKSLIDRVGYNTTIKASTDVSGAESIDNTVYNGYSWRPNPATKTQTVTITYPVAGIPFYVFNYSGACASHDLVIGGITFSAGCGITYGVLVYDNGGWRMVSNNTL